jgi:hypothetical protein
MEIATALAHKGYYMSHPCRVWGYWPNSTIEAFLDDLEMLDENPAFWRRRGQLNWEDVAMGLGVPGYLSGSAMKIGGGESNASVGDGQLVKIDKELRIQGLQPKKDKQQNKPIQEEGE